MEINRPKQDIKPYFRRYLTLRDVGYKNYLSFLRYRLAIDARTFATAFFCIDLICLP